jgi:hypothetical protein
MEQHRNDLWAAERLASTKPNWSPNLTRGRALLSAKLHARNHLRGRFAVPAAVTALCLMVLAIPATRTFAEDLWYRFVLDRVNVVQLDLSKSPLNTHVTTNGLERSVRNLKEAQALAGFPLQLPSPEVLPGVPSITVTGPISVEQTIRVSDMESALACVGASNVQVPDEWDGVQLHTEIGPVVTASYPGNIEIQEELPMQMAIPSGFPLQRFAEVFFESMGVPRWKADLMALQFADHPAWLLDIPPNAEVTLHELKFSDSPAFLMEELDPSGALKRATVILCTGERIYSVSSPSATLSTQIAEALS